MSLFASGADVKSVCPTFHQQNKNENLMPYIEQAACTHLHPYISEELYDDLVSKRIADNIPANQLKVYNHLRVSLAYFTEYDMLSVINVRIGNMGAVTPEGKQINGPRQWEQNQAKTASINKADNFLDKALDIMFANPDDFPLFRDSSAYTSISNLFINTSDEFSKSCRAITKRTFNSLIPWIGHAEEKYIKSAIGEPLAEGLKNRNSSNSLTTADNKILHYIKKANAFLALYMGAPDLKINISSQGIRLVSTNDGITHFSNAEDTNNWRNVIQEIGMNTLTKLKQYLEDNEADFPEYESSDAAGNETPRTTIRDNTHSKGSVFLGF